MYKHFFKRIIDFCIAFTALLIIWPLLLIVTIWLHFANKGAGAFFLQDRLGKNAKVFRIIKFKTMTDERDSKGNLLSDSERITKVGKFIRSTSIDELPQLVNILKGDMSLIGPRPLTPGYLKLYNSLQYSRMMVKPGITGLAQVNGRNHCKLSKKFELDIEYVKKCSLSLDICIFFKTISNVIIRKDVGDGSGDWAQIDDVGFTEKLKQN